MSLGIASNLLLGLCADSGSQTAYQVDSAWVFETSGEAVFIKFVAKESQTSGNLTLYAYTSAVTGTPTFKCELRNGPGAADDPDRPEAAGSALATSGDVSQTASQWMTYSLTGVTLVKGQQYFAVFYNSHATPASNYASIVYRGACDSHCGSATTASTSEKSISNAGYTTNGFTTDPSIPASSIDAPMVIKYDSGTIEGMPYVASESHASNTNDRGNRIQFVENISVNGHSIYATSSALSDFTIYQGASSIATVATDRYCRQRSANGIYGATELTKTTNYDFVIEVSASTSMGGQYTMGEAEGSLPADVLAARPGGVTAFVDGTAGSYTADTSKLMAMVIYVDDLVSAAGGGGLAVPPIGGGLID